MIRDALTRRARYLLIPVGVALGWTHGVWARVLPDSPSVQTPAKVRIEQGRLRTLMDYVQDSFLGLPGGAARALRKYAGKTPGLSDEDRRSLVELSKRRFKEEPEDGEPEP